MVCHLKARLMARCWCAPSPGTLYFMRLTAHCSRCLCSASKIDGGRDLSGNRSVHLLFNVAWLYNLNAHEFHLGLPPVTIFKPILSRQFISLRINGRSSFVYKTPHLPQNDVFPFNQFLYLTTSSLAVSLKYFLFQHERNSMSYQWEFLRPCFLLCFFQELDVKDVFYRGDSGASADLSSSDRTLLCWQQ